MSTVRTKTLALGDSGTLANNIQLKVPGVPDGTMTIEREDGTDIINISSGGIVSFAETVHVGETDVTGDSLEINLRGSGDRNSFIDFHSHGLPGANDFSARIHRLLGANGGLNVTNSGTGDVSFFLNSGERFRIASNGQITVPGTLNGTTVAVPGTGFLTSIDAIQFSAGAGSRAMSLASGASNAQLVFFAANVNVGSIFTTSAGTTYNTTSDYRLKEGIATIPNALGRMMQLKPRGYTWKADGSYDESFIAHELQEVCPRAVTGKKDAVNEDGTPDYQQIDPSKIVALLTAAMQEQQHIIEDLRLRVQVLEASK